MNFKKDLLLIDLEMTGLDVQKHEIIQLSAVLLDKKTLKEKSFFNSYIKPTKWKNRDPEAMAVNKISSEWLSESPSIGEVLKAFNKKFNPKDVILSYYGGPLDLDFLRFAYKHCKIEWNFDYHFFNLWALFFGILAGKNNLNNLKKFTGFTLEDLVKKYQVRVNGSRHDALTDCRIEAEILRKIIKGI
jgi:DNA polymerase III epsilon subunit-like protein